MLKEKSRAVVTSLLLCLLLLQITSNVVYAIVYNVPWDYSVSNWPTGKSFKEGDTLMINYGSEEHNVVLVNNKRDYDMCLSPETSQVYNSGHDQFTLSKGDNYFICGIPGHCRAGMHMAITAN